MKKQSSVLYQNKKAFHKYNILEDFEAGIALLGNEIKSVRHKKLNFDDAYAQIIYGRLFLINGYIAPYQQSSQKDYNPYRSRALLIKKIEQKHLIGKVQKGLTLIPLKVYLKKQFAKVQIGLAKGKRDYNVKRDLKEKDLNRKMQQDLRNY
jgi:SsrA-binding protein